MASRLHFDGSVQKGPHRIHATEKYYGATNDTKLPIKLRIATGGAGQSGLLKALADAFIDNQVNETRSQPFAVSWVKSDTAASFNHLADGSADLSITYNAAAERIAMTQGIADKHVYAWRDHFLLVGMHVSYSYDTNVEYLTWALKVRRTIPQTSLFPKILPSKRSSRNCSLLL